MRSGQLPINLFEDMLELYSERIYQTLKQHYHPEGYSADLAGYFARIIASNILTAILWWHEKAPKQDEQKLLELISTTVTKGVFQSIEQ